MTQKEKLDKMCQELLALGEDKQNYVLGILQALVFTKNETETYRPVEADENKIEGVLL
jgi:hypothetical protein